MPESIPQCVPKIVCWVLPCSKTVACWLLSPLPLLEKSLLLSQMPCCHCAAYQSLGGQAGLLCLLCLIVICQGLISQEWWVFLWEPAALYGQWRPLHVHLCTRRWVTFDLFQASHPWKQLPLEKHIKAPVWFKGPASPSSYRFRHPQSMPGVIGNVRPIDSKPVWLLVSPKLGLCYNHPLSKIGLFACFSLCPSSY